MGEAVKSGVGRRVMGGTEGIAVRGASIPHMVEK